MACLIADHPVSNGAGLQILQNAFHKALCNPSQVSDDEQIIMSQSDDLINSSLQEFHALPTSPNLPGSNPSGLDGGQERPSNRLVDCAMPLFPSVQKP
jgi:hypothetical protein